MSWIKNKIGGLLLAVANVEKNSFSQEKNLLSDDISKHSEKETGTLMNSLKNNIRLIISVPIFLIFSLPERLLCLLSSYINKYKKLSNFVSFHCTENIITFFILNSKSSNIL